MDEKLIKIELNLQQSLIWTGKENVCNAVCAITSKHTNTIVIRPEYRSLEVSIIYISGLTMPEVKYGDAFHVDTWDQKLYPETEERTVIFDEMVERLKYVVSWLEGAKVHASIVKHCKATIEKATK